MADERAGLCRKKAKGNGNGELLTVLRLWCGVEQYTRQRLLHASQCQCQFVTPLL